MEVVVDRVGKSALKVQLESAEAKVAQLRSALSAQIAVAASRLLLLRNGRVLQEEEAVRQRAAADPEKSAAEEAEGEELRVMLVVRPASDVPPPAASAAAAAVPHQFNPASVSQMLQQLNLQYRSQEPELPAIAPEAMSLILEMGFSEDRAKRALYFNDLDAQRALNWIMEHLDEPDIPLTTEEKKQIAAKYGKKAAPQVDPGALACVLAGKCTYSATGPRFVPQKYYTCLTCNRGQNEGVCESCAKICHAGHQLGPVQTTSGFYCDCPALPTPCKCLDTNYGSGGNQ